MMIRVSFVETTYPAPSDDEDDYCPDGDSHVREDTLSFGELVCRMYQYHTPSCSPAIGATYEWLCAETEQDYRTGDYTHRSMHYHHENHPRYAKYWRIAMRVAGLIK
jgi:hypothetical protein